jgi:hypothetical protein
MIRRPCLALVAVAASGCDLVGPEPEDRQCTNIGGYEGLRIEASRDVESPLPFGTYHFGLLADEIDASVELTFNCYGVGCSANDVVAGAARTIDAGPDRELAVYAEGSPAYGVFLNLAYRTAGSDDGGPAAVTLHVTHAQGEVARADLAPHYLSFEPNGPGCGVITQAYAEVPLLGP